MPEGSFPEGGVIEFFNSNYAPHLKIAGVGGSDKTYDFNDTAAGPNPGYGCMQVHNVRSGVTVLAYNNFNHGPADVGIGSNLEGENPDWTFMGNAGSYKACRLTVLVK